MTPVQLLRETQKAAGAAELTDWHEQLIGAGKELKAIQNVRSVSQSLFVPSDGYLYNWDYSKSTGNKPISLALKI
jgi:hypothetical protein